MHDITSFNAESIAESGYPLEILHPDGITPTGVTLIVRGKNSDVVNNWVNSMVNTEMREQQMARKRGRPVESKTMEAVEEQNLEGAVIRIVGWRGVKQDYSTALMRDAFKRNRHWIDQVVEASNTLGNFSTMPETSSASTPGTSST